MDKYTEKILTKDTLAESEKLLNKNHWSEFNETEQALSLLKAISDNKEKEEHLKSIGDTHFGMSWMDFKDLLVNKGFKNAHSYDFDYDDGIEEAILYHHPVKGFVIFATSFGKKRTINGGELYAEIKVNDKEGENIVWRWLSTGGCIDIDNKIYSTKHDVREGLFSKLNKLESAGTFLNKWTEKNKFLWFADYVETKVEGYDYKEITQEKINKCPQEFRDIMGK